jgi:hypothetical protein
MPKSRFSLEVGDDQNKFSLNSTLFGRKILLLIAKDGALYQFVRHSRRTAKARRRRRLVRFRQARTIFRIKTFNSNFGPKPTRLSLARGCAPVDTVPVRSGPKLPAGSRH